MSTDNFIKYIIIYIVKYMKLTLFDMEIMSETMCQNFDMRFVQRQYQRQQWLNMSKQEHCNDLDKVLSFVKSAKL